MTAISIVTKEKDLDRGADHAARAGGALWRRTQGPRHAKHCDLRRTIPRSSRGMTGEDKPPDGFCSTGFRCPLPPARHLHPRGDALDHGRYVAWLPYRTGADLLAFVGHQVEDIDGRDPPARRNGDVPDQDMGEPVPRNFDRRAEAAGGEEAGFVSVSVGQPRTTVTSA